MTIVLRSVAPAVFIALLGGCAPAFAQQAGPPAETSRVDSFKRDTGNFFGGIFGRDDDARERPAREAPAREAPSVTAQLSSSDFVVRFDRLENQIRQLTGAVEQLQYRNQQLEQQMKRMQEDVEFRLQEAGKAGTRPPPPRTAVAPPPATPPAPAAQQNPPPYVSGPPGSGPPPASPPGRRSDAFDPNADPSAPGVPRTMGTTPSSGPPPVISADNDDASEPVGVPGGRRAGAPLDLSTLSANAANDPSLPPSSGPPGNATSTLPPPPPRNPSATGGQQQQQVVAWPPNISIKDEYDAAYGSLLRKDYAQSEEGFRAFLKKHPNDRLVGEASYWLGESMFQRQRYRDAAEAFLTVSTKYERSGKAPEALLRLGQSLAALNEKESACATLGEITRKYPKASVNVKQGVERELKRARCS